MAEPLERENPTAAPRPSGVERDTPWSWLRDTVRLGGPGQCVFAINNACNAGCDFCNFALGRLPREDWKYVPLQAAREAIDVLHRNFIRYLVVTGGEPLLHPDVEEIIAHASDRSMSVLLVTNGSKLNEQSCRALAEAGTTNVIISIDAPTAQAHEGNRVLPKVCERIRKANALFRELGVQVTASVTMSRLVTSYDDLARFLEELGFDNVTFSYPLTHLDSSFLGFRSSSLVAFGREELLEQFEQVKALKSRFAVLNPTAGIEEMQRLVKSEEQQFECLGGYRYFYLDWNLMVWRCHAWDAPMCSIFDLEESRYVRDGCTKCMIDCFRDSSVMQHVAVSVADAVRDVREGHPLRAAAHLAKRSNLTSIRSAIGNARWIKNL